MVMVLKLPVMSDLQSSSTTTDLVARMIGNKKMIFEMVQVKSSTPVGRVTKVSRYGASSGAPHLLLKHQLVSNSQSRLFIEKRKLSFSSISGKATCSDG